MEKILKTLRQSRKAFLVEYFCGFLLLILSIETIFNTNFPQWTTYLAGGTGILFLGMVEFSRAILRYHIGETKLVITHGLIRQAKKHVYYHPLGFVPDINVHQGTIQRMLKIGTISIKGSEHNNFEIKNIKNPHKILELIESLIQRHKKV